MQHEHHRVPVTALAIWKHDVLLAGSGSHLKLYDAKIEVLLKSIPIFDDGQAIHGILVNNDDLGLILVWGGRYLRQLRFRPCPHDFPIDEGKQLSHTSSEVAKVKDWILDAAVCDGDNRRVAIITAHNSLILATPNHKSLDYNLKEVVPGANCILYCAHVTWLSPSSCLIASGTAFGDIIVWSWKFSQDDLQWHKQLHYSFSAHDGSVFGVQISTPEFELALGGRRRVLASCSDDRTVRLWDISDLTILDDNVIQQSRETGFGSLLDENAHAPVCLVKQMGHISRIWHIRYVRSQNISYILSFGEDATCITWSIRLGANSTISLEQVNVQKAHDGKHIWSVAVDTGNKPLGALTNDLNGSIDERVVTGGADGAIAITPIANYDMVQRVPETSKTSYRAYGFISADQIVAVTDVGSVELLQLNLREGTMKSEPLGDPVPGLRGYSTMATISNIAFYAGKGEVYYHELGDTESHVLTDVGEKVASLFAEVIIGTRDRQGQCSVFVTTVKSNRATWFLCQRHPASGLQIYGTCAIQLSFRYVVTSFIYFQHGDSDWIVLGSRNGCIAIYAVPSTRGHSEPIQHIALYSGVHGKETVTALSYSSDTLFSTGRDGTYAVHRFDFLRLSDSRHAASASLQTVHQLLLPLGPNIEIITRNESGDIWVGGFRGKQFVVFDTHSQREVMVVECGGAHRNFAFQPGKTGGTFVWTKTSELYFQHQGQLPYRLLTCGGHGREIKATAVSPISSALVATGAEDTNIKLHLLEHGSWRCVHTLQKHITGIQHLQWSEDGSYLFSSGGVEEFYIWRISHDVSGLGIGAMCESMYPHSTSSDLRIMSFDVQHRSPGFDITMVYSDSGIKKWRYHIEDKTWALLAGGDYLTSCLTQCLHLGPSVVASEQDPYPPQVLLTASTDGHLALWNSPSPNSQHGEASLTWHTRHKVHQNSILSLITHDLSSSNHILISGGDDNALGVTFYSGTTNNMSTLLILRAHAAAVTALQIVRIEAKALWLASASIDQRVKLWHISFADEEREGVGRVDFNLLKNIHTAVADVSSLEVVGEDRLLVCGVGMDLWKVDWDELI